MKPSDARMPGGDRLKERRADDSLNTPKQVLRNQDRRQKRPGWAPRPTTTSRGNRFLPLRLSSSPFASRASDTRGRSDVFGRRRADHRRMHDRTHNSITTTNRVGWSA